MTHTLRSQVYQPLRNKNLSAIIRLSDTLQRVINGQTGGGGDRERQSKVEMKLRPPVVELHFCRLPLFKAAGDVGGSSQDVLHIEEKLLGIRPDERRDDQIGVEININRKRKIGRGF